MAIEVRKEAGGRTWGVFMNSDLVEGCFVSKSDATASAKRVQADWNRETRLAAQRAIGKYVSVMDEMSKMLGFGGAK